jgi:hypothetical protein
MASANIHDIKTQECITDEIRTQYERYFTDTIFKDFIVFEENELNWEVILLTKYTRSNAIARTNLKLEDGDYKNSSLLIEGAIHKLLDIRSCF